MAVVNPMISPIVYQTASATSAAANVKDSRWLTLDVCREFTRNKCSRSEDECRFAHPPPNVEVQNGRVMCCFDSIKGKCQRRDPPCKYLHPPQHLKEQLLQNGRNNLILKHLQMQMMTHAMPGVYPIMYDINTGKSFPATSYIPVQGQDSYVLQRYLVPVSGPTCYSPYYAAAAPPTPYGTIPSANAAAPAGLYASSPVGTTLGSGQPNGLLSSDGGMQTQQLILAGGEQQNGHHVDRNEQNGGMSTGNACGGNVGVQNGVHQCSSPVWHTPSSPSSAGCVMTAVDGTGANYTSPVYFQAPSGIPGAGMVPVMKPAGADNGKCGVPFYQPAAIAYQQMALAATMQLQQPTYVPIAITGHPQMEPRY